MSEWLAVELDPAAARAALAGQADDPMAWHRCGIALARAGMVAELLELGDVAASRFGSALRFFQNVLLDLMNRGAWTVLEELAGGVPAKRPEYAPALYYRGCVEVAHGRHGPGLKWFARFASFVVPRHKQYPIVSDQQFNLIFRQGTLVTPPELVARLITQALRASPPIRFVGDEEPTDRHHPFVAACVLDKRYFARFASELCSGHEVIATEAPLHFHVLSAGDDIVAAMEDLRDRHPGLRLRFSYEAPSAWDNPVYYTCARFLVVPKLMTRYGAPVVVQDADIVPTLPMRRYADAARHSDFACFETGRTEPASFYQASIMVFDAGAAGARFVDDLGRLVGAKLATPPVLGWMLDQASMYSLLEQRRQAACGFRFTALDQALGAQLSAVTRQLGSCEEKRNIMNRPD